MSAPHDISEFNPLIALNIFSLLETLLRLIWSQPTLVTLVGNWLLTLILHELRKLVIEFEV